MIPGFEGPPIKASRIYRSAVARVDVGLHDPTVFSVSEYTPIIIPSSNQPGTIVPALPISGEGHNCPILGPCASNCMRTVTSCSGRTSRETCCGIGFHCENGKCVCPAPNSACSLDLCTNTQTDPRNCGGCGNSCNGGSCSGGKCVCSAGLIACGDSCCPEASACCNGSCADLQTDASNCGSCGNQCQGVPCVAGLCQCPQGQSWTIDSNECLPSGTRAITATLHGPQGISASVDMCYCTLGPPGTPVATETPDLCTQGHILGIPGSVTGHWNVFDPTCCAQSGSVACGGVCCPTGPCPTNATMTCTDGTCGCTCNAGLYLCGNHCWGPIEPGVLCCNDKPTYTNDDPNNCGKCGNVCPAPGNSKPTCINGLCGFQCKNGFTFCSNSNSCWDLHSDLQNCGACGNVCGPGQQCVNGVCESCGTVCQACDLASGHCGLQCPPNAACQVKAASGSDNDYALLSKYLTSQGFTAVTAAPPEAIVLLKNGAVVAYSYNATLSGSGGEAIISFIANSSYASQGSYVLLSQNSVLEYVLFVDANGTLAKVSPASISTSSPPSKTPRPVSAITTTPAPGPPQTCIDWCNFICKPLLVGEIGALTAVLGWELAVGFGLSAATGGVAGAAAGAAVIATTTEFLKQGATLVCAAYCPEFCACNFTGFPCGVVAGCCPFEGYACVNGECMPTCSEPCAAYNYQTGQCENTCTGDPCFQCDTSLNPIGDCNLIGTVRCGQPGQPGYTCCPVGQECCTGACTDTQSDDNNCGGCGQPCVPGLQTCQGGKCICVNGGEACAGGCCDAGEVCCNGTCVDPQSDSDNCGGCNQRCDVPEWACSGGTCVCAGPEYVACGPDHCMPLDSECCDEATGFSCDTGQCCGSNHCCDPSLCCNKSACCELGQDCCGGQCCDKSLCCANNTLCCAAGETCCGGEECANLLSDNNYCGDCTTACNTPVTVCQQGQCVCNAAAGYAECNGSCCYCAGEDCTSCDSNSDECCACCCR
jgi:hypothetical protein